MQVSTAATSSAGCEFPRESALVAFKQRGARQCLHECQFLGAQPTGSVSDSFTTVFSGSDGDGREFETTGVSLEVLDKSDASSHETCLLACVKR